MPARNERDSIIFAGTMGLLRRSALERLGGWDEWTITEDAETSLRLLRAGWSGFYVGESFGRGIMPLTFAALKRQRFRWCFGGMQILRKHWRELMPWDRHPGNRLSFGQRMDYLLGGLQWLNDLVYLFQARGVVCRRFEFPAWSETAYEAEAFGEPVDPARHFPRDLVKAATYHGLSVRSQEDGFEARVILDV